MSGSELNGLPPNWAKARLGDVLPLRYGKGLTEKHRDASGPVPVYGSSGLLGYHSAALTTRATLVVGRKGSVGEVHYSAVPCWPIDTTYFVEETESLNLPFFAYLLKAMRLGQLDKSTAVPGLGRDDYNVVEIPVPPLAEQRRIVAEIEKQFTRLGAAVGALKRAKANLKRYRASVLKAACEGRLVPTEADLARVGAVQEPPDGGAIHELPLRPYEPADQLLARILKERRARWETDQLAKMQAAGKPPKDDKWKTKYKEPTGPQTANLPKLQEGWVWASLDQIAHLITSGSRGWADYYADAGALFVRAQDINTDRLELGSVARVQLPAHVEGARTLVQASDLLVTITGANVTKTAIVRGDIGEAYVSQHVGLVRLVIPALSDYSYCWVIAPSHGRRELERLAYGAGKPGLNLDNLRELLVAIPPLPEQRRVVAEVERRLSVIDELEAMVEANLKRAERLRQAILKRAFEGKLVPQNPSDEPASVLLERIRAERRGNS